MVADKRSVFAGQSQISAFGAADAQEHGRIAFFEKARNRKVLAQTLAVVPDTSELGDGFRFLSQKALGKSIRRDAAQRHAARLGVLVVDVDRIAH